MSEMSMADKMVELGYGFPSYLAVALAVIVIPLIAIFWPSEVCTFLRTVVFNALKQSTAKRKIGVYFYLTLLLVSMVFGSYEFYVLITLC